MALHDRTVDGCFSESHCSLPKGARKSETSSASSVSDCIHLICTENKLDRWKLLKREKNQVLVLLWYSYAPKVTVTSDKVHQEKSNIVSPCSNIFLHCPFLSAHCCFSLCWFQMQEKAWNQSLTILFTEDATWVREHWQPSISPLHSVSCETKIYLQLNEKLQGANESSTT